MSVAVRIKWGNRWESACPRTCWAQNLQDGCKYKCLLDLHKGLSTGESETCFVRPVSTLLLEKLWKAICPSASYLCKLAHPIIAQTVCMLTSLAIGFLSPYREFHLRWSSNCNQACMGSPYLLSVNLTSFSSPPLVFLSPVSAPFAGIACVCTIPEKTTQNLSTHHPPFFWTVVQVSTPRVPFYENAANSLCLGKRQGTAAPKRPTCFLSVQNLESGQFLHCLWFSLRIFPTALFRPTWPKETLFVHYCSEGSSTNISLLKLCQRPGF